MQKDYYVVVLWGDVETQLHGPYPTAELRDQKARELRNEIGTEHGFFRLAISKGATVDLDCYLEEEFE